MSRCGVMIVVAGLAASALAGPDPALTGGRPTAHRPTGSPGGADAFPFSDGFDSYPAGPGFPCATGGCIGPGNWELWYTGGVTGDIVSGGAHSGANYLLLHPATDVVQTGNLTTGQYVVKAMTYAPSSMTGDAYFIIMDAYNGVGGADHWSVQVQFSGDLNFVENDYFAGQQQPLIRDQWVEIRAEIDLNANTQSVFYNNVLVSTGTYTLPPGVPAITCLDLYADAADGFRYDTVSVAAAGGGGCYANCDNSTATPILNVADFTCFLQRYAAGQSYANCDNSTTPPTLNVADFTCFLQRYAAGCP